MNSNKLGSSKKGFSRAAERRLVAAARRGDRAALGRVLERVSGPVYRFGRTFCRNAEDAEEVMQDVMTALVRSLDRFRGEASLTTWAYAVARNVCGRKRRRKSGEPERVESIDDVSVRPRALAIPDHSTEPSRAAERSELRDALASAIGELPGIHREVILLRDVEGLPAKDVAATLGIGERAVKSRLHRARTALREALLPTLRDVQEDGKSPRCPDVARMLSRYLEDDLDAAACRKLERHVSGCRRCGAVCDALRTSLRSCRRWGAAPVPPDLRRRIRAAIRSVIETQQAGPGGVRPQRSLAGRRDRA